ncbi:MAG TPA: AGE family epimerase/isomerase [Amycolatopsis sp.]|jgi:N-acylglucosamine 2-epimerase|nr:AGE family epimerase/isomerase [Amycolatopsis sp.]
MPDPGFYRRHLEDDVLAWWLAHGPDPESGGVRTCFANSGDTLLSTDKYTWSQGRWVWLTARLSGASRAGLLGLDADSLLRQATGTAEFVADHALLGEGTTAYVLAADGTVKPAGPDGDPHASVFADLFAALGFAGLHGELAARAIPGTRPWGTLAETLLVSAYDRVVAGTAKNEPYPVDPRFRCFAEPMMLMHAGAELFAATGSDRAREITVAAAADARSALFVTGTDVHDLAPRGAGLDGSLLARHRTPGHLLEFLWFLHHAASTVPGVAEVAGGPEWTVGAALGALELGWDTEAGGLFRYVDAEGGAPRGDLIDDRYENLVTRTWDTKLWWPHVEALYATALLAKSHGSDELAAWRDRLHDYAFATFPEGPGREWAQIRGRDGRPLDEVVALPVKDPFHIARALLLLVELLGENEN